MNYQSEERRYNRRSNDLVFNYIGNGELGGKASGLVNVQKILEENFTDQRVAVSIPHMTVIRTEVFSEFMKLNKLYETAMSTRDDAYIAHAFQKGSLPPSILGDLRDLISKAENPLAVRSSSLLEDSSEEPFAGVYATKMLPNNQRDIESRFRKLSEAIKFIYSSLFFRGSKDYFQITGRKIEEEKMAVIIQDVVGNRYGDRYYPVLSGVGRSYNYYPAQNSKSSDGVVNLALGLGKTIVDGGVSWIYSPQSPQSPSPYNSIKELLDNSQRDFWAVKMGKILQFNPVSEIEFMQKHSLEEAEADKVLETLCSTYDFQNDRLVSGTSMRGARLVDFSPILKYNRIELNQTLKRLLEVCREHYGSEVEIEFALEKNEQGYHLGFLQVRSMQTNQETEEEIIRDYEAEELIAGSDSVLGNGKREDIRDIIYVKPENFDAAKSRLIAGEIAEINRSLTTKNAPYVLIGFGRWGSSDPWLGIPVSWSNISGARVIVEATLPNMKPDLSQGSHFFHNLIAFGVFYFSIRGAEEKTIDWKWLNEQEIVSETEYIRHIRTERALDIRVAAKRKRGVILK